MGMAALYRLPLSHPRGHCPWPRADIERGPTRSMPTLLKGKPILDGGMSKAGSGFFFFWGAVCWHWGQCWLKFFTLVFILGQRNRSFHLECFDLLNSCLEDGSGLGASRGLLLNVGPPAGPWVDHSTLYGGIGSHGRSRNGKEGEAAPAADLFFQ